MKPIRKAVSLAAPPALGESPADPRARRGWRIAGLAAAVFVVAALAVARDPWADEADLLSNFLVEVPGELGRPMGLAEQVTPLGHRLLGLWIAQFADEHFGIGAAILAMRSLSAAAAGIMALCLSRTVRLFAGRAEAAVAVLIAIVGGISLRYATEIKHYVFEGAATAALVYTAALLARDPSRRSSLAWFLTAAIAGSLFSFTLPLVLAACAIALFLPAARARLRGYQPAVAAFLVAGIADIAFYLLHSRPVMAIQYAVSPDIYAAGGGALEQLLTAPFRLVHFLYRIGAPIRPPEPMEYGALDVALTTLFGVAVIGTTMLALRRSAFVATVLVVALGLLIAANGAGLFPFRSERHFLFLLPLLAAVLAIGAGEAGRRFRAGPAGAAARWCLPVLALLCLVGGAYRFVHLKKEEVSPLLTHARAAAPDTPVWVYYSAQSAVSLLAPPGMRLLGLLDHSSAREGWSVRSGARDPVHVRETRAGYLPEAAESLRGLADVWLLFTHAQPGDPGRMVEAMEGRAFRCRLDATSEGALLYRCLARRGAGLP